MLERIREGSQSFTAKAVLVLIILTFALAGVGSYVTGGATTTVAEVNDAEINQQALDRAYENERSRLQEQFGDMFEAVSSQPGYMQSVRANVLEQLIQQELLVQYARDNGMRVSAERVKQEIRDIPAFRSAGQFDNDIYLMALRNAGYTPEQFAAVLRDDLIRSQIAQAIGATEFALSAEALALQRLQQQTRSGAYIIAENQNFVDQVELTDDDIQAYYDNNQQQFQTPEQLKVAFVQLSKAELYNQVNISDEEVREYYDASSDQYRTDEERRVAHILIENGTEDAQAKAEQALAELNEGADFAAVAAEYSDDTFSAEQGGDLDWITKGSMDENFDNAAFALENVGDVSGIVETSFGFHIIKLLDLRAGEVTPFEEVAGDIRQRLKSQQVDDKYFELQQKLAEVSFEQPDTLEPAADAIGTSVRTSDLFTRQNAPTALSDEATLNRIFNPDLIDEKLNSDVIETADDRSLVVRVLEHKPQAVKPLDDVRSQIVEQLRVEKAQALALEQAETWKQQWAEQGEPEADYLTLDAVSMDSQSHPRAILRALFSEAPAADGSAALTTIEMPNGDAAVVALTQVNEASIEGVEANQQLVEQLQNRQSQLMLQAFVETLVEQASITRMQSEE
ncbi:peptidyl-prolyl cis-trans isomerase D [Idiomarina fontislapidosi]|uniref:Periplasmic chaperone PpiD n=1 Tax=Idiomarina fontislapidosi TaxID=263723 RepID=A0A432YBC6_9GAMM|nr:SurA N-terminal domain-containing protein [Idiomarina fontislapidosi]PYE35293.1 peptidyl-prolyl cis-trans isomerase D [Idiomarina fontislapidosi]RUO58182.1 peptidylprolyl isomerase [Idiomarina fontislapidosi]